MAPGRGQWALLVVAALAGITVAHESASAEEQLPRLKFRHSSTNQHASEWIAGPNGYLYQFHIGEQSWLAAREFCLAENADLVSVKTKDQLDWLLQHYAPTHPSFEERFVQIGLVSVGEASDYTWLDGTPVDQSIIQWATVPGTASHTRCAHLKVNEQKVESIKCDAAGSPTHINRFVCQRSTTVHQQQQRSNNYIWRKLENLLNYFGMGGANETPKAKKNDEDDYWQAVENLTTDQKKQIVETVNEVKTQEASARASGAKTEEIEGSGAEDKIVSENNSASREERFIGNKDEAVLEAEKKSQEMVAQSLPVLKEAVEEKKDGETAVLIEKKEETVALPEKKKEEEEDALNKPTPLRELLDIEEGSGAAITEREHIEGVSENDADLLASPTPTSSADIDTMIDRMERLLENLQGKTIGPILIEKATTSAPELIPIGPIVIEKAPETNGAEKLEKSSEESKESKEEKEDEKEEEKKEEKKEEEKKKDKSVTSDEVERLSREVKELLHEVAAQLDSIEEKVNFEERLLTNQF